MQTINILNSSIRHKSTKVKPSAKSIAAEQKNGKYTRRREETSGLRKPQLRQSKKSLKCRRRRRVDKGAEGYGELKVSSMGAWQAARRERAPKRVWRKNCRIVYLKNIQQQKKKK